MAGPVVETRPGRIEGALDAGVSSFKGIPFAAPISGEARWLPPQPPASWDGVRPATAFGDTCPQGSAPMLPLSGAATRVLHRFVAELRPQGDDCLNLNVWTPAADSQARLPVLVFIHGGSLALGAGSQPPYDGTHLARRGAVVVTVNYRLAALGFLAGDELFDGDFCCANRGFLDQVAALEWVRDNVAAFGGDPARVTIFGESAGAVSVFALLASPLARGLFARAITQSGAAHQMAPLADHTALTRTALERLGVAPGDRDALTSVPIERLLGLAAGLSAAMRGKRREQYGKIGELGTTNTGATGTRFLPHDVLEAAARGSAADVDVIVGTNLEETRCFPLLMGWPRLSEWVFWLALRRHAGDKAQREALLRRYRVALPDASRRDIRERLLSDAVFRRSSIEFAEHQARSRPGGTWMYRFDWRSPAFGGRFGAMHALELPFTFDNLETGRDLVGPLEEAQPLADRMAESWIAFARDGVPRAKDLPEWPTYSMPERSTLLFDRDSRVASDPDGDLRQAWLDVRGGTSPDTP